MQHYENNRSGHQKYYPAPCAKECRLAKQLNSCCHGAFHALVRDHYPACDYPKNRYDVHMKGSIFRITS